MALLGFKKEFSKLVESGVKRQTIRAERKRPVKVGDPLILAEGVRTKHYREIGRAVCESTFGIRMIRSSGAFKWFIAERAVNFDDPFLIDIANRDGFDSVFAMSKWFADEHLSKKGNDAFIGQVIRW